MGVVRKIGWPRISGLPPVTPKALSKFAPGVSGMLTNFNASCGPWPTEILESKLHPRNELLAQLLAVPDIASHLISELTVVPVTENQVLYRQGDRMEFVYFPLDSVISSISITEDGSAIETSMVGWDGLAGMSTVLNCEVSQQWLRVTIGGRAAQLEGKLLGKLLVQNEVALKSSLKYYRLLLTQLAQRCACNSKHTIMERLCCWLLMICDRVGPGNLRLTHEVMAERIGARRAGITVAARTLQESEAINYRRGRLHIRNRTSLEQMVCECYKVMAMSSRPNDSAAIQHTASETRNLTLLAARPQVLGMRI